MKKAMLIILDGFGYNPSVNDNAVYSANKPFINKLLNDYPVSYLKTFGKEVGLPDGIMGNSEVGHLNIGAGRVVYQLNTLIDHKIETGEFFENPALLSAINHSLENNSALHLMGLLSDGGVHSSLTHLFALIDLCKNKGVKKLFIHCFMDGRDTLPHSGIDFIQNLQDKLDKTGIGKIATICGRYYAMDRDNRWERVEKAYRALTASDGEFFEDPVKAVQSSYNTNITDEFILPKIITENGSPLTTITHNDSIIFFNFRSDRAREISRCFIIPDFTEFHVTKLNNLKYVSMTEYDIRFDGLLEVAFTNQKMDNILGKVLQDNNVNQLRLAETEKYAHVTFFFNGGVEQPFINEDRILVQSPKIPSYDLQPEMSAFEVKNNALSALNSDKYQAIIINFANCDMVGHTGVFNAAVKAVETVDQCLSEIVPLALEKGFSLLITADHGNAEQMKDENGNIMTAHSLNPVPLILLTPDKSINNVQNGVLADLAPTMLKLMELNIPAEMTGKILI